MSERIFAALHPVADHEQVTDQLPATPRSVGPTVAVNPPASDNQTLTHLQPEGLTKAPHLTLNQFLAERDRFRDASKKEVVTGGMKDAAIIALGIVASVLTGGAALPLLLLGAPLAIAGRHAMADKEHRNEYFHQLDTDKLNNTVHWLAREEQDPQKKATLNTLATRFNRAVTKNNVDDMIEILNKLEEMASSGEIDHHIDFSSMKRGIDTTFEAKAGAHVTPAHFAPGPKRAPSQRQSVLQAQTQYDTAAQGLSKDQLAEVAKEDSTTDQKILAARQKRLIFETQTQALHGDILATHERFMTAPDREKQELKANLDTSLKIQKEALEKLRTLFTGTPHATQYDKLLEECLTLSPTSTSP